MIPPRAILAAVNFSDTARVALAFAARLAQHCGAELHVLYAENPLLDAAADHAGIRPRACDEPLQFVVRVPAKPEKLKSWSAGWSVGLRLRCALSHTEGRIG